MFSIFSLLFVLILTVEQTTATYHNPVILIPGCMGSKIEVQLNNFNHQHWWCSANKDWFLMWINVEMFLPELDQCLVDYSTLLWENGGVQFKPGTAWRVVPGLEGIEYLQPTLWFIEGAYANMIKYFEGQGYEPNIDLFGLPYDFRLGPTNLTHWFLTLKSTIEFAFNTNGNQKVNIVTHSMGGKLFAYFMQQQNDQWKQTYISKFIPIAPAFGGALESLQSFIWGLNFGDPVISATTLRPMMRSFPGLYYMLPYNETDWPIPVVSCPNRNYESTYQDYQQLFHDFGYPSSMTEILTDIWPYIQSVKAPRVPTYILYGHGIDTDAQFKYTGTCGGDDYETITATGDGRILTQTIQSVCADWSQDHFVSCEQFLDHKHVQIIAQDDVIARVWQLVQQP